MEQEPQPKPRKFYPNKLVRDKIPQMHLADGWDIEVRQAVGSELHKRQLEKLSEECHELQEILISSDGSRKDEVRCLKEVADIQTVQAQLTILGIEADTTDAQELVGIAIEQFNLDSADIERTIAEKTERNGNFSCGLVLYSVEASPTVKEDDWLLHYYREQAKVDPDLLLPPIPRE